VVHIHGEFLNSFDIIVHGGTLPSTTITTLPTAASTIASYTSWTKISNDADVPTNFPRTIDIHYLGFASTARHG
jgi:hypothetical protein